MDNSGPMVLKQKNAFEKFLSLFSDVRAGEGNICLLLALNVFLLLGSYYLVKTVRESLILSESGAAVKSYSGAAQAALLLLIVPLYSRLASHVNRIRLIRIVTLFFASNLVVFYVLGISGLKIGVPFFLWVGIFNLLIVAQFWSFANDIYTEEQGKRLFPIVGFGASLGAFLGSLITEKIFGPLGPYNLMLLCCGGLLACLALTTFIHHRTGTAGAHHDTAQSEASLGNSDGFKLVLARRYLLLIALLTVALNITNSVGEYLFGNLVTAHAHQIATAHLTAKQIIGETYASYFAWFNGLTLAFQLLLVARIFRTIGVRGALFILPCVALGSYSIIAVLPMLSIVRFGKIMENSTDYSIQNTTNQALFLLTSREEKYKAKNAIDTFFWRGGDFIQAMIIKTATVFALSVQTLALVNVGVVCVWLMIAYQIFREHKRLSNLTVEAAAPVAA